MTLKHKKVLLFGQERMVIHGPPSAAEIAKLIQAEMNVLFIGRHGTGKTQMVRGTCADMGLDIAYYNTPTLDPYIDFLGIPSPAKDEEGTFDLLKSRQLRDAEVLFFDELNRSDDRIMNALFQIVQLREVQGTKLPKVRAVFAAMNPNDGDYHVAELDPAFIDRFDQIIYMPPKYDAKIISAGLGGTEVTMRVARALCKWVKEDVEGYVSPRKVEGIGRAFLRTGHQELTLATVPVDINYGVGRLWERLLAARDDKAWPTATDPLSADGAAKAGTMNPQKDIDKPMGLKILRLFRDAVRTPGADNSAGFYNDTKLGDYTGKQIAAIEQLAISPSTIGQTRSFLETADCFTGNNATFEAMLTGPHSGRIRDLLRVIRPANNNASGYDWFNKNGLL